MTNEEWFALLGTSLTKLMEEPGKPDRYIPVEILCPGCGAEFLALPHMTPMGFYVCPVCKRRLTEL